MSTSALGSCNVTLTSTVSQERIDEQLALEREQISQGKKALMDQTIKAENRAYASATVYGVASIQELIPLVEERLTNMYNRIHEGKNGVAFKEVHEYIKYLEPLAAAGIASKVIFDRVFSQRDDRDSLLVSVFTAVGTAIEDECQMRFYEREAPGLLKVLKENYWHSSCGTGQKLVSIQTLMNRYNVNWKAWSGTVRTKLGNILVDSVMQASGWFEVYTQRIDRRTYNYLVPTKEFMDNRERIMESAMTFSAELWPMLIPPLDWSNEKRGGYLTNEVMMGHKMVRSRTDPPLEQGEVPISFLNRIQKVAYRLSPFMVGVAERLYELGRTVGKNPKFLPITAIEELPAKPFDIDDNPESRKAYKVAAREIYNRNQALVKKSVRTRMTMKAVARFKDVDRFYIPWSFDYRGRAYPIPAFLTPQDTDFGKSLLRFADEAFLTPEAEDWLAFQVATTYGLDKAPMAERLEWVSHHHQLIEKVATDPIGSLPEWEAADEPWQFLAACEEYYACFIACTRHHTGLMIATDATCSGLQILAGLARDRSTAQMVNVVPSHAPQDAYRAVAEFAKPNLPEHLRDVVDRSVAKRLVMTIPYNAKFKSNWRYVNDALNEVKKLELPKEDVTAVTHALRNAVWDRENQTGVFPGPIKVMDWIESEVGAILKSGGDHLQWVTPSGFVVYQKLMKPLVTRLELQLLGSVKKVSVAVGESTEVNIAKHKSATSPNLIHSLDASLLHLTVQKFDAPIALIHDSVLCRATDMSILSTKVRETYMELFAEHDYLSDFAQQIGATSEPPIVGDLSPEVVIESTYFFC